VRSPWLLIPFGALNAAAWALWSSREWEGGCIDYVDQPGECWVSPAYIAWSDTLIVALVIAAVVPLAVLGLWRVRRRARLEARST
jgi:hypothetical protein